MRLIAFKIIVAIIPVPVDDVDGNLTMFRKVGGHKQIAVFEFPHPRKVRWYACARKIIELKASGYVIFLPNIKPPVLSTTSSL